MRKFSKTAPIFLLISVLLASGLRFFQYVSILDFDTGFFTKNSETAGLLIYIMMILAAVIYVILLLLDKKNGSAAFSVSSDGMGSHATQVLGLSEMAGAFIIAYGLLVRVSGYYTRYYFIGAIAVLLLITSFLLLKNTVPPTITGHLKLVCAALMFFSIAELYEADLILIRRSDRLILMLAYIFAGAFFASTARAYSRVEMRNSRLRELITAGFTFILCGVHLIPKLLAYAFGGSAVAGMEPIDPLVAAVAVISGAFIGTLYFTKKTKDIIPIEYVEEDQKKKKKKEVSST